LLAQLEQGEQEFKDAGLQVVAVAMGEPKHNQQFCGKLAPSLRCLTDETTEPYSLYGLNQAGLGQIASLNVAKNGMQAALQGHQGGIVYGDVKMLPGTFVVDMQGKIAWAYYSKDVSDHPTNETIIKAAVAVTR
jgi:peroxiredoxin